MDPSLTESYTKIEAAVAHFQKELATIRAGKANPSLIEEIPVNAYGSRMKLLEVGTISSPQPSLLTIQVWDSTVVKDVEKAIQEANLGLTTSAEGNVVRVPIPALTEERRLEYAKVANQKGEQAKVEIRQVRADSRTGWQKMKEAGEIGEDELYRREKLLQELIDKMTGHVDELVKLKEEELKQI